MINLRVSIVPSKTKSAGPVSVTLLKLIAIALEIDLQGIAAAHQHLDRAGDVFVAAKIIALATTPVPQARVSSSTPRS